MKAITKTLLGWLHQKRTKHRLKQAIKRDRQQVRGNENNKTATT